MKKCLTAFDLKIMAVALMFLDHIAKYLPTYLPGNLELYFRYAGRIVAPIFFYLAVESYFHTSSKKRYIIRLYIAALVMVIGNIAMFLLVKSEFDPASLTSVGQNIFLTIAIGVSVVAALDWEKKKQGFRKVLPIVTVYILGIIYLVYNFDLFYSLFGLVMFCSAYFLRKSKYLFVVYSILPISLLISEIVKYQSNFWYYNYQWFVLAAIPFLLLYNGKRGRGYKYFFYIFYGVHIWILYYLSYYLLTK